VVASTRAALDYLQKLYGMFGDWQLALAAYNWGEGNVGRAIAKNQRAGLPTTYSDLTMPAETRLYVPKLQACVNIVANPGSTRSARLPITLISRPSPYARPDVLAAKLAACARGLRAPPVAHKRCSGGRHPEILLRGTTRRSSAQLESTPGPVRQLDRWTVTTMTVSDAASAPA
jgi:membrane-bound lytic murein transglycosylase D